MFTGAGAGEGITKEAWQATSVGGSEGPHHVQGGEGRGGERRGRSGTRGVGWMYAFAHEPFNKGDEDDDRDGDKYEGN